MRALLRHAAQLGFAVHLAHLEPGVLGECYLEEREVYVEITLAPAERREVCGHELGHAYYGDVCDPDATERDARARERRADAYAAMLLVDPAVYADIERINPDTRWIAEERGLSASLVEVYAQTFLTRIGNVTYVRPRMGARQWSFRSSLA
jgi:Zn-dependent peptidase ImmA (M78 family)